MVEWIRKHAATLTSILLAWLAWSDLGGGDEPPAAAAKSKRNGIPAACLALRDDGTPPLTLRDPYAIEPPVTDPAAAGGVPAASRSAPTATTAVARAGPSPAELAAGWSRAFERAGADLVAGLRDWDPLGLRAATERLAADDRAAVQAATAAATPPPARFTLELDAILHLGDGGLARISGQTVAVGETLRGLDDFSPPLLAELDGSRATLLWRGEDLLLDLDTRPRLDVVWPLDAAPPANAVAAGAAAAHPSAASGPSAPPRAAAAPRSSAPRNPVSSTGSRVRGKLGKKGR